MNLQSPVPAQPGCRAAARAARQREVETALLVQTLCGQPPSPDALDRLRRYEAGELPREQAFMALYEGLV